jgi:hypothetical protein
MFMKTAVWIRSAIGEFSRVKPVAQERSYCGRGVLLHIRTASVVTKLMEKRMIPRKALCIQGVRKFAHTGFTTRCLDEH